jgi:hypothetical protein
MNMRLKLAFALFTLGAAGAAMAANYKLTDVDNGSTYVDASNNAKSKISAACSHLGGRIVRWDKGASGKENGQFYAWFTGHCNGAN